MFSFQESCRAKLRLLRQTHNLSSSQFAELFDFKNKGSVSHLESGMYAPTLAMLEKVVQIFAVSPDWLFGLTDHAGGDDAMSDFQKSCREKLRLLRETHKLSTLQETEFLGFKSKGSVADLESGKACPALATLDDAVNIFSVSLDWLAGRVNSPYREEIIAPIEAYLLAEREKDDEWLAYYRLATLMIADDIYADPQKRMQAFSLPVRANMIFALQVLRHNSIFFHSLQFDASFNGMKIPTEVFSHFEWFHHTFHSMTVAHEGKRKANIRWNLCSSCCDLLMGYIVTKSRTEPVFDICNEC